jgi:hypothetical protein
MLIYTEGGVWQLLGTQNYETINELYGTKFDENDKFCAFRASNASVGNSGLYLYSLTDGAKGKQIFLKFETSNKNTYFSVFDNGLLLSGNYNSRIKFSNGYDDNNRFFVYEPSDRSQQSSIHSARESSYSYLGADSPIKYSDTALFVVDRFKNVIYRIDPYINNYMLEGTSVDKRSLRVASTLAWYYEQASGYVNIRSNWYDVPMGFYDARNLIGRNVFRGYYYNASSHFSSTHFANYIGDNLLWEGKDDEWYKYKFFLDDPLVQGIYVVKDNVLNYCSGGDSYFLKPLDLTPVSVEGSITTLNADNIVPIPGSYFIFYRKDSVDSVNRVITCKSVTDFSVSSTEQLSDSANICYMYYSKARNTYIALCIDGFHIYSEGDKSINISNNGGLKAYVKGSDTNVEIVTP